MWAFCYSLDYGLIWIILNVPHVRSMLPTDNAFYNCAMETISPNFPSFFQSVRTWWRHQMETFSALLTICAGNSSVPGEFPAQRPVTRSFDVFFDLCLNIRLSKPSWGWWFETLLRTLWRHRNELLRHVQKIWQSCHRFGLRPKLL